MKITRTLLAVVLFMLPSLKTEAKDMNNKKDIKVVAHRGYWNCEEAGFARNSLAALECALKEGFWGSEFDVNITKDNQLIVFHDAKTGKKAFNDYPFSEFKDVRLENGEPIPTVDQFFEIGKKYPETVLVYELKPQTNKEFERKLVDATIAKIKEHGLDNPKRIAFISFSFDMCKWLAKELPGYTVQYLGVKSPYKVHEAGINGIDTNKMVLKIFKSWVEKAHKQGMSVNCWTVNDQEDIEAMVDLGVDYITSDYPTKVRYIINNTK